jgi:hypothetical protein
MGEEALTPDKPKKPGLSQIANWFVVGTTALGLFKTVIEYITAAIDHQDLILAVFIHVGTVAFMMLILIMPMILIFSWFEPLIRRLFGRIVAARYNNALGLIALCAAFVFTIVFFAFNHSAIISGLDLKSRYFYAVLGAIVVALTCIYAVLFAKRYAAEE